MARKKAQEAKGAVELIEEAVHLLRSRPLELMPAYSIGTLPFVLGLLFFWGDMSRNAYGAAYCAPAALGLALLFAWMKCWQVRFLQKVRDRISPGAGFGWTPYRVGRLIASQTLIHGAGLFLLPFFLLLSIPFGWAYAFFQNGSVAHLEADLDFRRQCRHAWNQAKLRPAQNHALISLLFLFGLVVFLNLAITLIVLPQLFKTFFGVDTLLSMSPDSFINTTFLAVVCGLTYVCMDPLVKTVYLLRCYYGRSLRTGEDLRTELNRHAVKVTAALLLMLCLGGRPCLLSAEPPPNARTPENESAEFRPAGFETEAERISPEALDRAIDAVLQGREFAWRMPQSKEPKDEPEGPIASLLNWMGEKLDRMMETLVEWMETVAEWFEKLFPDRERNSTDRSGSDWMVSARGLLYVLVGLTALLLIGFGWWAWKNRVRTPEPTAAGPEPVDTPDVSDETVTADEFPTDRWLRLAGELADQGDYRLALRAIYLGTLSHLAEHGLISIAKYKSNREYETELVRRSHDREELTRRFSEDVTTFDTAWYGLREVSARDLDRFSHNQQRIMALVRQ